jgi:hypothetical protein
MPVYLHKTDCDKMLQKTLATACKKLHIISEIKDKSDITRIKLVEEVKLLNNIMESINIYLEFDT